MCCASAAGLQYALDSTTLGFQLTASGYSHKLPELVTTVLAQLAELAVKEDRFEVQRSVALILSLRFLAMTAVKFDTITAASCRS